jgi:hypothetical protein
MTTQSADIKYHHAFERFIHFLVHLRNSNAAFKNVIEQYSQAYLLFYCQGLSHRLLRTPIDKRQGLSINKFIEQCKGYSRALGIEDRFHPTKNMSINAAKWIDRFSFSRALFLRFKKMFPKPLLK